MVQAAITGSIGVTALAGGVIGWFATRCSALERILLLSAGLALIDPNTLTDVVGLGIIALVFVYQRIRSSRSREVPA
ncbi:hypothetical protein SY88_16680 [Clostridiales bacterium PH28_bin88]|nr:hypothetical protein SY88_16680 [Clostridiales bacterium PH28_bin88]